MTNIKKEKVDKQMVVMVQPSLYESFESKCVKENKTVSEVIREFMSNYDETKMSNNYLENINQSINNLVSLTNCIMVQNNILMRKVIDPDSKSQFLDKVEESVMRISEMATESQSINLND